MLGKKQRQMKLLYQFSLEAAVPADDFYRKLEQAVDLGWVRRRVADRYATIGRPSIDPEVIVKIELIGYLEGITSERQLMRQIADRLSLRRYLGYDLDEAVPDHSTLSRARDLLGKALFQEVFDHAVRLCQAAGMVGGLHVSVDRTLVSANASLDSLVPRQVAFSSGAFVERLFAENPVPADRSEGPVERCEEPAAIVSLAEVAGAPQSLPTAAEPVSAAADGPSPAEAGAGHAPRAGSEHRGVSNATHVSRTDPDARIVARDGLRPMLGYSDEYWTDSRCGVITHADAVLATVPEAATVCRGLRRQRTCFHLPVAGLSADKGYGQGALYRQLEREGVVAHIPHRRAANATSQAGRFGFDQFHYDAERDVYVCPAERDLDYSHFKVRWPTASRVWRAKASDCQACPERRACTQATGGRELEVPIYQADYAAMDKRLAGPGARLAAIARRTGPEPRFGQGKQWQGLGRAKYRGLAKVQGQALLTAAAQNLKKYVRRVWRRGKGAGLLGLPPVHRSLPVAHRRCALPFSHVHLSTRD